MFSDIYMNNFSSGMIDDKIPSALFLRSASIRTDIVVFFAMITSLLKIFKKSYIENTMNRQKGKGKKVFLSMPNFKKLEKE